MSLRDVALFGGFAVLVPWILIHPYIGALAWVLFGVMNPHRLTWGAAYDFQFAMIIAVVTFLGLIFTREHRKLKGGGAAVVLLLFLIWICIANLSAFHPTQAISYLERVVKIFLMTGVLLVLLHTQRHVELLIWTLVISLGFYGLKGGIFVAVTSGQFMVNGPPGSVMEGNNSLAVGLSMMIPLMNHLVQQSQSKWVRRGLFAVMGFTAIAILGSYSRGALLAIAAMCFLLWIRSSHKVIIATGMILIGLIAIPAMPDQWNQRMRTIETYEEDTSASNRLVAWRTAFNIAKDKFPVAGGFEWEGLDVSQQYSPIPAVALSAHSIYFEVLGSVGFVGLALFLLFWLLVWRQCVWVRRVARDRKDFQWAFSLASMTQVSLVAYAVGGAFLNVAFWDLPYYLFAAIGVTRYVIREKIGAETTYARSQAVLRARSEMAPRSTNIA